MSEVASEIADLYGLTVEELKLPTHRRSVAWPRQHAMYEMRQRTNKSYPQIGRFFGVDHSTVIHGCRRHAARTAILSTTESDNSTCLGIEAVDNKAA